MSDAATASMISPAHGAQQLCNRSLEPLTGGSNLVLEKFSSEYLFSIFLKYLKGSFTHGKTLRQKQIKLPWQVLLLTIIINKLKGFLIKKIYLKSTFQTFGYLSKSILPNLVGKLIRPKGISKL